MNWYVYASNNPVIRVDPNGLTDILIEVLRLIETNKSTISELYLDGEKIGYTLELPWNDNKNDKSRIPAGSYEAFVRKAGTGKWSYDVIELRGVPGRAAIQMHRGNEPRHTTGCILPGTAKGKDQVTNSKVALDKIMNHIKAIEKKDKAAGETTTITVVVVDPVQEKEKEGNK